MISTLIRSDLLLQFSGRAEYSFLSLCAKINVLLIFNDKFCSFIGEYYGQNPRQSALFQHFPREQSGNVVMQSEAEFNNMPATS
jgi:hypothetical protein